jgi:hypothetical protein
MFVVLVFFNSDFCGSFIKDIKCNFFFFSKSVSVQAVQSKM